MSRFTTIDIIPTRLPPVYGYHMHPLLPLQEALSPLIQKMKELQQFINIAKRECHFPSEHGLTREESASIYIYTMEWGEKSLYRVLNAVLREKDRSVLVPWHGYLKLFDTALKKLPSVQTNLWRGINRRVGDNFTEKTEITWWNFSSCSSSVNVVKPFLGPTGILFMIEAKNGKDISLYSNIPDESEVILSLGTRIRIKGDLDGEALMVIHCLEFNDEKPEEITTSVGNISIVEHSNTVKSKLHLSATSLLDSGNIDENHKLPSDR